MSCCCKCKIPYIPVTGVTVSATTNTLDTSAVLATELAGDTKMILVLDPTALPTNGLPVVLSDGTTTIPLTMPNGNVMRENIFQPFCMHHRGFDCQTKLKCFYGADAAHILVFMSESKRR